MSDDIFDYFSGNSARKVEPIEDDDDHDESSIDSQDSDASDECDVVEEASGSATLRANPEREEDSEPVANEPDARTSHWDRLLGKLGIAPAAKKSTPPKSIELPTISAEEKAARALKRKELEKTRGNDTQPFGGVAAPAGSKPSAESSSPGRKTRRGDAKSRASAESTKSRIPKKDKPAKTPNKFGMGILDEISFESGEHGGAPESETLAELFVSSEEFQPPFEEVRREIDDLAPIQNDDLEPSSERIDSAPEENLEPDDNYVARDTEFIEYEVQDLDFSEATENRSRRPSRRDRARRSRPKPENKDQDDQPVARGRREQATDDAPKSPAPRRGRRNQDQDEDDLVFERNEPAVVEAESTPARGRRRSRGRGRGRGTKGTRPSRDFADREELDEVGFDEPSELSDHDEVDVREQGRDRGRGRKPRGGSRPTRDENRVRDDENIEGDPYSGYDDIERDSGRGHTSDEDDTESDAGKRPQIPTWSDAVASMVELNIKNRGSKSSGSGRGRGPRRPRRR